MHWCVWLNLSCIQLNKHVYWHNTHLPTQIILINYWSLGGLAAEKSYECYSTLSYVLYSSSIHTKPKWCVLANTTSKSLVIISKKKPMQPLKSGFEKGHKCHHHWIYWPELPVPTLILIVKYCKSITHIWATCIWVKIIMFIQ